VLGNGATAAEPICPELSFNHWKPNLSKYVLGISQVSVLSVPLQISCVVPVPFVLPVPVILTVRSKRKAFLMLEFHTFFETSNRQLDC
jgi:hypothetical protein